VWNCTTVQLGGDIYNSCFSLLPALILLADGAKFIGSAQLIRGGAILQHGSMIGARCHAVYSSIWCRILNPIQLPSPGALIQSVTEALIASAGSCFGVQMSVQPLSQLEWEAILSGAVGQPVFLWPKQNQLLSLLKT